MEPKKQSQISISSEDFQGILESIGYNLIDCGDHWRAQAVYRDGDNETAVKIYKNTGVWMDFVTNTGSKPFEALVKLTLKDEKQSAELLGGNKLEVIPYTPKETIEMERIYSPSVLERSSSSK